MGERLLPEIGDAFYDRAANAALTPIASALLTASSRPFSAWQQLRSRSLPGDGPIARLFGLHRAAFEAERAARCDLADFYWGEFYRLLPRVWGNEAAWTALIQNSGAEVSLDPAAVRARVAREVICDSHLGFYAAYRGKAGTEDRAITHLEHMLASLKYCAEGDRDTACGDLVAEVIRTSLSAENVDLAFRLSSALLEPFQHEPGYQALHIQAAYKRALAEGDDTQKARRVRSAIEQMNVWRATFDDHSDLYDALGVFHFLQAVTAANKGEISDALVSAAKAEVAHPGQEGLAQLKEQLSQMMRDLQQKMSTVEASIAATPNAQLNAEGQRLLAQARRGFEPATAWRQTDESKSLAAGRTRGVSRTVWRNVGLPIEQWTEPLGFSLIAALNDVLRSDPGKALDVGPAWRAAASRHQIADVDPAPPVRWLTGRLELADPVEAGSLPVITLLSDQKQPGHEPLREWLTSGGARRVRWQLTAAALLAVVASGLFARDAYRERIRNGAWEALQHSPSALEALNASEEFFSVGRPRHEPRERESGVWDIYARSIVRVLADSSSRETPEIAEHVTRFANLAARIPKPVSTSE